MFIFGVVSQVPFVFQQNEKAQKRLASIYRSANGKKRNIIGSGYRQIRGFNKNSVEYIFKCCLKTDVNIDQT